MNEIWKDIEGFEGYYQVSNLGRVKSLDREITSSYQSKANLTGVILKQSKTTTGYWKVDLYKEAKRKICKVHRLIAKAFIPNPENKPFINHKNGIKDDNRLENLEWCTSSENTQHAYDNGMCVGYWNGKSGSENHSSKPIQQFDADYNLINEFAGQTEAQRITGIQQVNISKVCLGKRNFAGGFRWKYKEQNIVSTICC